MSLFLLFLLMKWCFIVCLFIKYNVLDIVFENVFAEILWGILWMYFPSEEIWVCFCQVSRCLNQGPPYNKFKAGDFPWWPMASEREGLSLDTPLHMGVVFIYLSIYLYVFCALKEMLLKILSVFFLWFLWEVDLNHIACFTETWSSTAIYLTKYF